MHAVDGGFTPLRTIPIAFWLVADSLSTAKPLQFALILCNVATYAYVASKLLRSNGGALLATACALMAWQLRYPHDPTIGSSYQWPWLAELVLFSLYALLRFAESTDGRWLTAALLTAAGAGLSSPGAWLIVALLGVVALTLTVSTKSLITGPLYFLLAGTIAVLAVRAGQHSYATPRLVAEYTQTVARQAFAALPTTYRGLGNVAQDGATDNFRDTRFESIPDLTLIGWLATITITIGVFAGLKDASSRQRPCSAATIVAVTIALWLGPAFSIGPVAYWHNGLPWGQTYPAVYLEQFGIGLALACILLRVGTAIRADKVTYRLGVALVTFLISFGNVRANAFAIQQTGLLDHTRSLIERAGGDRFFAAIPVGSTIVVPEHSGLYDEVYGNVSDARVALYHFTGREFKTVSPSEIQPGGSLCRRDITTYCAPRDLTVYILRAAKPHLVDPQLALSRWIATRNRIPMSDEGHGFAAFPSANATSSAAILLSSPQRGVRVDVPSRIEPAALAFTATRTCGPVPEKQLFRPSIPTISWGSGFYPPTGPASMPFYETANAPVRDSIPLFRWAASRATLVVHHSECAKNALQVTFYVVTSRPSRVVVRWESKEIALRTGAQIRTAFQLKFTARAAEPSAIDIATTALPFSEEEMLSRRAGEYPQDRRMLVLLPAVAEFLKTPLNLELNPAEGLL